MVLAEASSWLQILGIIVASVLAFYLMARQAREMEEVQRRLRRRVKRVTVVECGGQRRERPFHPGDYVGKKEECPGTEAGEGVIVAIYAEEEQEKEKGRSRGRRAATLSS